MGKERFNIDSLNIKSFRGLENIKINHCKRINILLGDNNSGKTSFLESIYLLRNNDLYNFVDVARCRQNKTLSIVDVSYMYPIDTNKIEVDVTSKNGKINFSSTYSIKQITFDKNYYFDNEKKENRDVIDRILETVIDKTNANGKATKQLVGEIKYNNDVVNFGIIDLDFYSKINKADKNENKVTYISPYAHYNLSDEGFSRVISNKTYHNIIVSLLKLFDETIEDVFVASRDEIFGTYGIEIRRQGHSESEPINLFGDDMISVN